MSIRETNVVDWLGIEKGSGHVVLTLIDDADWENEQEHLLLLEEKLNSYLAFIESGEAYKRLGAETGRADLKALPIKVNILARHPPSPRANEFLEYAIKMFRGAGLSLTHKVLPVAG